MTKPDHSLHENNGADNAASLAKSTKAGGWYELAHWITGISSDKSLTFKDILDNFRNIATMLTVSLVFTTMYANNDEPKLNEIVFRTAVGSSFLILLSLLVLQSVSLLHLSQKENSFGYFSKAGVLGMVITFIDSILVGLTAIKLFTWILFK